MAAADDVRLVLPETGVCTTRFPAEASEAAGCCGGPAPRDVDACCVADAVAKDEGKAGCGCAGRGVSASAAEAFVERASSAPSWRVVIPVLGRDADPCLGLVLLSAGRARRADRRRHGLAAGVGRRRPVARPAHGRLRLAAGRRQHPAPRRPSRPRHERRLARLRPGRSGALAQPADLHRSPGSCSASAWAPVSTMRRSRRLAGSTANGRARRSRR